MKPQSFLTVKPENSFFSLKLLLLIGLALSLVSSWAGDPLLSRIRTINTNGLSTAAGKLQVLITAGSNITITTNDSGALVISGDLASTTITTANIGTGNIGSGVVTNSWTVGAFKVNATSGTTINKIIMGTAVLSSGAVTVSQSSVTANSRIFLTRQTNGGTLTNGLLSVSARTPSTSFAITSGTAADTNTVAWLLLEP